MKALLIIAACLLLASVLKGLEAFFGKRINSVGSKAGKESRNIPTFSLDDAESLKAALDHYKDLAD